MSQNVAPWLQGLDDDDIWEVPAGVQPPTNISSASHDADSLRRNSLSRIPRRSISGLHSSLKGSNYGSTSKRRNPLAALSDSNNNSLRRPNGTTKLAKSRSFSGASDESVVQYDTVQQRSKSASPRKQDTMEWKKRLLDGKVGYGDQTDLFGPSGLENIFAKAQPKEEAPRKTRSSLAWMDKSAFVSMPSSPPPWPSRIEESSELPQPSRLDDEERLTTVDEEHENRSTEYPTTADDSYVSNPFDLRNSDGPVIEDSEELPEERDDSSPERLLPEAAQDNIVGNRTVSGQTEISGFSPVIMAKHTTVNGQVVYKALESRQIKDFQNHTVNLKHPSQQRQEPQQAADEQAVDESGFTDGPENESPMALPDFSLSEALATGTPPVSSLGDKVQFKRGGYSAQGSFKDRLLSASQSSADRPIICESSRLLSPLPSSAQRLPSAPSPPANDPTTPGRAERDEPRSRSSGSPLKLFGPHDTFTSNRLLRRMSQLDPDLSNIRSDDASDLSTERQQQNSQAHTSRSVSAASFGSGELNHHGFNAEITITSASDSDKADSDQSPGSEVPPPGSKNPLAFRLEDFQGQHETLHLKRKLSKRSDIGSKESTLNASTRDLQPKVEDASEAPTPALGATRQSSDMGHGKRPPNSPFKAPTPKRRRTLHAEDLENEVSEVNRSYHDQLQDVISNRKRRESRRGSDQRDAEEAILAQRKMLRPRNPTPSQRRRDQIEAEIRETAEQFASQEPEALEAVMEQIESSTASGSPPSIQQQAKVLANEVAKFSLRVQKASADYTERKRSVTTQDFFNEAVMVMRLIREKAGRTSGLGSVAESDQEALSEGLDNSAQDLSSLRVSRPPSREGVSGWRPRTSEQTDARVISHLRKFQENDDTEFIAQSVESIHVDDDEENYVAVDEHSNIRIKGPLTFQANDLEDDPSRPSTQHSQQSSVASQGTQNSSASSTGRTLLSRKSDNVGTLAPDAVAHLIGEQVGAMTYDKDKQQWVKVKSPQKPQYGSFLEPPSNITSDDDPFREISDLKVDVQKEEEIRKASTGRRPSMQPEDFALTEVKDGDNVAEQNIETRTTSQETVLARPDTRDSNKSRHTYSSSDPSRYTGFASSQHHTIETRATSWGTEELERLSAPGMEKQHPLAYAAAQAALALSHQSRAEGLLGPQYDHSDASMPPPPIPTMNERIPESVKEEPVEESIMQDLDEETRLRDDTLAVEESEVEDIESPKLRQAPKMHVPDGPARQVSLRRKTLTSKFRGAEQVEHSELSFVAPLSGERMMSVSLSVSRPLSKRQQMGNVLQAPSSPIKYDPSYILSDLPEFTVHEEDHERPSERALAQRLAQHAAAEVGDRYALAVKDLVKTLTDVKSEEPHWEHLKQLDLSQRSLSSVHGLNEFCGSVQDMDLSENELAYLNGVPSTIRHLVARENQLSSLTPWTHLMNLQYLDVSGNQLQSLDGLACLIHLRELRADDNAIDNLNGIMGLDGLLKFRARRNMLTSIDLEGSHLQRLESLDLCGNSISSVCGLHNLVSLETLRLDDNTLLAAPEVLAIMTRLKHLSLKNCGLQHLDVSNMPNLRTLMLDGNSMSSVIGIEKLHSLEVLSMRRQTLPAGAEVTILEQEVHARTIHLSENDIPFLRLSHSLLSLQHLEIASCGLQDLPIDFGLMLPNLQSLNLNFNSLKDIRPLLNIQKLERLSVCGNRLERLRKTAATLSKMPTLTSVDLRDNHLTLGLYPPHSCAGVQTSVVRRSSPSQDDDEETERLAAAKCTIAPADPAQEKMYNDRLDESTKLKKRVYQLLLASGCAKLETLDGMVFDKEAVRVRDAMWERLIEMGIVRRTGGVGVTVREV